MHEDLGSEIRSSIIRNLGPFCTEIYKCFKCKKKKDDPNLI